MFFFSSSFFKRFVDVYMWDVTIAKPVEMLNFSQEMYRAIWSQEEIPAYIIIYICREPI